MKRNADETPAIEETIDDDTTIEETLAPYADDVGVVRELHDVPPYRVYEVRLDGRRAVLKVDDHERGHAADEGRVQEYVATETAVSAPAILAVGDDHYLAAWDDDVAAASETVDAAWARDAGAWLGRLHADTAGDFDDFGRPRAGDDGLELAAREAWIDAARERIAYHRPFLEAVGHADVADAVDRYLERHPDAFDGAGEPVLCHGNGQPEHLVRSGEGTLTVIDFEHALIAPGEYDYWRTATPYLITPPDVDEAVPRAFREGYESVRSLPAGFERRRPAYEAVNCVAFLESLYLQGNVGPDEREAAAERLRTIAFDILEKLRAEG